MSINLEVNLCYLALLLMLLLVFVIRATDYDITLIILLTHRTLIIR